MSSPFRPRLNRILMLIVMSCVFQQSVRSQTVMKFSPLGSANYKEKIAQLESYVIPKKYTDKSSQAWYEEMLTERNKSLLEAFRENDLVVDSLLLDKCNSIFKRIAEANKQFRFDSIRLYINRSMVANAANYGEGTVMVNLGLFLWIDNDDELALVLAHELSHQLLNHLESKMQKNISILTSDDFKDELKSIKRSDYGKFQRFRQLMKDMNMEAGSHSRFKESEADSLGVVLAKNAKYDVGNASRILLKLDKVEDIFKSNNLYTLKDYFEKAPIDLSYFKPKPKYNGLSSVKVTMNADKDFDSIKTHPDCVKRFEMISGKGPKPAINCCTSFTSQYSVYKERAMLEIVRHLYEVGSIGLCAHMSLFALRNSSQASLYNYFLSLCFSRLYEKDKMLARFSAANAHAPRESNLKELQDFLFALNTNDLDALAVYFLKNASAPGTEDYEFANMMYNTEVKMKDTALEYSSFNRKFPDNKYNYLLQKK